MISKIKVSTSIRIHFSNTLIKKFCLINAIFFQLNNQTLQTAGVILH